MGGGRGWGWGWLLFWAISFLLFCRISFFLGGGGGGGGVGVVVVVLGNFFLVLSYTCVILQKEALDQNILFDKIRYCIYMYFCILTDIYIINEGSTQFALSMCDSIYMHICKNMHYERKCTF